MSKHHQANRRRTYGPRQHDLPGRRYPAGQDPTGERDLVDDALPLVEAAFADGRGLRYGATWLGLE